MKDIRINAKVIKDFNDSQTIDKDTNEPMACKVNDIIENMPRGRFNQLKSMGYVEEYKEPKKEVKFNLKKEEE